jgi:hypothetical protein
MLRTTVAQIATAAETPIPTLAFPITCAAIHLPLDGWLSGVLIKSW